MAIYTDDQPGRPGARPTRVAVLDDYQSAAASFADWEGSPHWLQVTFIREPIPDSQLVNHLLDFDVIVAMRERTSLPASIIRSLPNLRLIVTTGRHNASIDTNAGVMVCGTEALSSPTPELTWALIMAHSRHLTGEERSLRFGSWQTSIGEGLAGNTLGILGLGRAGARVARVGLAFGMNVIAWSQNLSVETAEQHGVQLVHSDELFARSDVLTIHLRLSPRTHHLVDETRLRSMKSNALLVNTSRAGIVDQEALTTALTQGWIGGAAIDVYDQEPIPAKHPLLSTPHTLLTPHIGYVVRQNYELFYRGALESITAYLDGDPIRVLGP